MNNESIEKFLNDDSDEIEWHKKLFEALEEVSEIGWNYGFEILSVRLKDNKAELFEDGQIKATKILNKPAINNYKTDYGDIKIV